MIGNLIGILARFSYRYSQKSSFWLSTHMHFWPGLTQYKENVLESCKHLSIENEDRYKKEISEIISHENKKK